MKIILISLLVPPGQYSGGLGRPLIKSPEILRFFSFFVSFVFWGFFFVFQVFIESCNFTEVLALRKAYFPPDGPHQTL